MPGVPTFTKTGNKATKAISLNKNVFSEAVDNHSLLKFAYNLKLHNSRDNLAKTKERGEVRGGGRKPWVQKGTGRARHGSIRSPLWKGGGVTFGPSGAENYSKKITKRTKKKALRQALSLAYTDNTISVIEQIEDMQGRTKNVRNLLDKLDAKGSVLIVVDEKTDLLNRSINNLSNVKLACANYLTVYDILNSDKIIITKNSLEIIENWLSPDSDKAKNVESKK